ncbi:MAG: hypothetical protein KC910_27320 [Candidatus Eremiobacteraeota bacterium]|nr:hypothetical protein [Candidatus Eremiobacteraeota bacterium]
MKTRILLCLLLCSAVFAAGKIQLRYKPEPQSSWSTSGSLTVKNTVTFPDGAQTSSTEQYDLAWQDKVLSRDLTGAVTQQRELQRWSSPGQENVLPGSPIGFQISKFAEQQVASSAGLASSFNQPALYPLTSVAVGESWPVEGTNHAVVAVGNQSLPVYTRIWGTGTLVAVEGGQANLELKLESQALGPRDSNGQPQPVSWATTESKGKIHWTMQVDLATGVAVKQTTHTTIDQTVTLGPDKVLSHTESTLELSTR